MKKAWLSSISRHPWITLLLVVVVAFAASYGGKNLYFRGDYKVFFDKDFPQLLAHEEMQRIFNKNDNVSIIVVPKEGSVFNQEMLAQIKQLTDEAWQAFIDKVYDKFKNNLNGLGVNVVPVKDVINSKAYADMKAITDTVTSTFIEKGAYGTKRLIRTGTFDYISDIKTTFPSDYTNEKIIQELNLDGLIAVTIDLDFDLKTSGLNPVVKIVAFAPNVSYRMAGHYFQMDFSTKAKSLEEAGKYNALSGGPEDAVYNIIKGDELMVAFKLAMDELKRGEKENPAYEKIWKNRMN